MSEGTLPPTWKAIMETLLAVNDFVIAQSSDGLVRAIRDFVGPILLLGAGIAAISFLWQRQITQVIIFLVIFTLVAAVFYAPDFIGNLGTRFGQSNSSWG